MSDPSPFSRLDHVVPVADEDPLSHSPQQPARQISPAPQPEQLVQPTAALPIATATVPPPPPPPPPQAVVTPPDSERSRAADPEVFWADHNAWMQSVKDAGPHRVTVDDPVQEARSLTNLTPHVTYAIATESSRVRRRYSDFEVVRAFLQARYIGILIPSLPEKRVMGNTNDEFLQDRARGLQAFLQRVLANPYLMADAVVKVFLFGDAAQWEVTKKGAVAGTQPNAAAMTPEQSPMSPPVRSAPGGASHSEERWRSAVTMSALPDNADELARKTRQAIVDIEALVKALALAAAKTAAASKAYAGSVADLYKAVAAEKDCPARPVVLPLAESWTAAAAIEPVLVDEMLVDALNRELFTLREMRALLESREEFALAADMALRALHKLEVEREGYERAGQLDRAAKTQVKMHEALRACKSADYRSEFATKALLVSGLGTFIEQRLASLSELLGGWAVGQVRYCDVQKNVWMGAIAQLRLEFAALAAPSAPAAAQLRGVEARIDGRFAGAFTSS